MRPVNRGASPLVADFNNYRDAFYDLHSRIGSYCSYCERFLYTNIAVEHIHAKGLRQYQHLEKTWSNFLLGCVNCNSTKGDKNVHLKQFLLPDRDNTFCAYVYHEDGTITVAGHLSRQLRSYALNTLALVGLDKEGVDAKDSNGIAVAVDRVTQREYHWKRASAALAALRKNPTDEQRDTIKDLALATGFFSVWMTVFKDEPSMLRIFIDAFNGTRLSGCFHPKTMKSVSPSPNPDGLVGGGKI